DPSSQRWRHVLRIASVVSIVALVLLGSLATAIMVNPGLPTLSLAAAKEHLPRAPGSPAAVADRNARFARARARLEEHLKSSLPPQSVSASSKFERIAFYVNWDDNSWVSLKRNLDKIDTLMAEWLHLQDGSGQITVDDARKQDTALRYIREHR